MHNQELKSFRDLNVWQKSADLAVQIYAITEKFPKSELYGLTSQMRRAIISVSSNLAEGFKRSHQGEKYQFYNIAYGSVAELESQIEVAKKLGFLSVAHYQELINLSTEVSKMTEGLIRSQNSKSKILNSSSGFTVVELIVAIGLFTTLFGIVSGSFINALRTERRIVALVSANDSANGSLEQMAREIRTGLNFDLRFDLRPEGDLTFTNYKGENITYTLGEESIKRGVDDVFKPITADNVRARSLNFFLCDPLDCPIPRVTIATGISAADSSLDAIILNMQTSVSARF